MTGQSQVQGYDCVSTGTQAMPPSWTDNTDPNAAFDTKGRVYQTTLPFNAFWEGGLHPNAAIDLSYSDDLGLAWIKGNGGRDLERQQQPDEPDARPRRGQGVGRGQPDPRRARCQDHVYAMWTVFNGSNGNGKIRIAVSRDRGQTFAKAITITPPGTTTPATTYVYPSVGSDGTLYVAFVGGFDTKNKNRVGHVFVTKSVDDGKTFGPFVQAATPSENPDGFLPNTNFRDGIIENFTASPTYPGHAYLTYEDWDRQRPVRRQVHADHGRRRDVVGAGDRERRSQLGVDRPVPAVGRGRPGRRRRGCLLRPPGGLPERPEHPARRTSGPTNTCIDISLQAYKDGGQGAAPVGGNVRVSQFTLGSRQSRQHGRRDHSVRLRRPRRPVPAGTRLHRRLLRARDLGGQRLRVRGLHPLSVEDRRRRRRRPGLLPEPSAGNRASVDVRSRVLS